MIKVYNECQRCGCDIARMSRFGDKDICIYKCVNCNQKINIIQTRIPYAFKLLSQELYTMNIMMRFICN